MPEYTRDQLSKMRVPDLKQLLQQRGLTAHGCLEKADFVDRILESAGKEQKDGSSATAQAAHSAEGDERAAPLDPAPRQNGKLGSQASTDAAAGRRKFDFFNSQQAPSRAAARQESQANAEAPQKRWKSASEELKEVKRQLRTAVEAKDTDKVNELKQRVHLLEALALEEVDDGHDDDDDKDDRKASESAERRLEYSRDELMLMRIAELKALLRAFGLSADGCIDKEDFVDRLMTLSAEKPNSANGTAEKQKEKQQTDTAHRQEDMQKRRQEQQRQAEGAGTNGRNEPKETREELLKMSVKELKALMRQHGLSADGCLEKADFVDRLKSAQSKSWSEAEPPVTRSAWPEPKADEVIAVTLRTNAEGCEAWRRVVKVSADTHIGAFRTLLSTSPHDLPVTLRTRFLAPDSEEVLPNSQPVVSEMILANFDPEKVHVRIRSSLKGMEHWQMHVELPIDTQVQELKKFLRAPPHDLPVPEEQQLWQRPLHFNSFIPAEDTEPVLTEVVLIDFQVPRAMVEEAAAKGPEDAASAAGSKAGPDRPSIEKQFRADYVSEAVKDIPKMDEEARESSMQTQGYWARQRQLVAELEQTHASQGPRTRRAYSWARSLAFAQVALGDRASVPMRKGTSAAPFIVWVLGANDANEASLAEAGFFDDTNWISWAPTEVVLFGHQLRKIVPSARHALEGHPPLIRTMEYEDMIAMRAIRPPDLVTIFMPELPSQQYSNSQWETESGWLPVPQAALAELGFAPVVITFRCQLPESAMRFLRDQLGRQELLLEQTRCPFSSCAGAHDVRFDDNGWMIAVRGRNAAAIALNLEVDVSSHRALENDNQLLTGLFWGIIDLKYDPTLPVLERVRVLETGDGRISKFSNDGAHIKELFDQLYKLKPGPAQQKHIVVSSDKKLTHDLIDRSGYGHILPKQVCFPRHYSDDLANGIAEGLGSKEDDKNEIVVLKLCNRSRGAGVLVVPVTELDTILGDILEPPADMDAWFKQGTERIASTSASDLGIDRNSFEEQMRHWWGNESPVFVTEKYCASVPTMRNGKGFDGTMRVSFVIRHKQRGSDARQSRRERGSIPSNAMPPPEELEIEWLGGYWKLPKADTESSDLRGRSVSAARSGTAPVRPAHLHDVYAALGDSMQQLFGGAEPMPQELLDWYKDQPELAAYLIARLGMSGQKLDIDKAQARLNIAEAALEKTDGPGKKCVVSYLCRARGIAEIKPNIHAATSDNWRIAEDQFLLSVTVLPNNANALFWLGMAHLEAGRIDDAVEFMNCSLLLDPDFKGPYVNLGVAYLRQGKFHKCIEISNAGLARHPDTPMCNYHIGVASYQTAVRMYEQPDESITQNGNLDELLELSLGLAVDELMAARESDLGQKRAPSATGRHESPWLEADNQMLAEATALQDARSPAPRSIEMPPNVGWRFFVWKT